MSIQRRETYKYFLYIFYKFDTEEGSYPRPKRFPNKKKNSVGFNLLKENWTYYTFRRKNN